jgi:hypothetical protein
MPTPLAMASMVTLRRISNANISEHLSPDFRCSVIELVTDVMV